MQYHFRDVYRQLTMIAADGCAFGEMEIRRRYISRKEYKRCMNLENGAVALLKEWEEPIDIIFVFIGYMNDQVRFNEAKKHDDSIYMVLQKMYGEFGKIARDVVFIPQVHFFNGINSHMALLQRRVLLGQNLQLFSVPHKVSNLMCTCLIVK